MLEGYEGTKFENEARCSCEAGFEAAEEAVLRCTDAGDWSGACDECTRVVCVAPPVVEHASHSGEQQEHVFEDVLSYVCDEGMRIMRCACVRDK